MERRKFLLSGGAFASLAAFYGLNPARSIAAENPAASTAAKFAQLNDADPKPLPTASNDLTPYTGAWSDTQLLHLLRRSMLGVPYTQFQTAKTLGSMKAVIDKLVDTNEALPAKPAAWVDEILKTDRTLPTDQQAIDAVNKGRHERMRVQQVVNWWFDLMVSQSLSIREKMTLMWSNHFVVGSQSVSQNGYLYQYTQTLRKNALGNLKQFVYDISIDPAMLVYLNGNQSYYSGSGTKVKNNVNENYARELMELFTLGLLDPKTGNPNYTEDDIQNSAQALSGWVPTTTAPFIGQLVSTRHNNNSKTFFGQTGNWGLQDIINMIFAKGGGYNTAYFFAQKIYTTFVYYVPNAQVVDAMAQMLIANNFEIAPVMKALLGSAHFYDVNVISAQLKSPLEYGISLLREFGISYPAFDPTDPPVSSTDATTGYQTYKDTNLGLTYLSHSVLGLQLGQDLLNPPNVKGWPGGHNWISTGTFPIRQQTSIALLTVPNIFDGQSKRSKGITLKFDPQAWAHEIAGADTMKSTEIAAALEQAALSLPLGPNETGNLHTVIFPGNLPEYDFDLSQDNTNLALFAQAIATLPEFHLV